MALLIKCWFYGGLNSDIEPTDVTSPCYRNGSGWDVIDNNTPIYNSASTPENTGTSVATTEGCYGVWIFDEEPTITQDPAGGVSNWFYIKWQSEGQWLVGVQSTAFGNDTFYGDYPSFSTKSEWLKYITNPKDVIKPHVLLKWSDPPNITDWEPTPCNWEGTVVIRKEDSPPMHRWDGIKIVGNKRRDKYKTEGYKDEDIKMGMTYYYGFFPYYTADDSDPNHPLRYYRFTKVIKVETGDNSLAPVINSITVDGNSATINYSISEPDGSSFASVKLYGKIGKNPKCDNTDDVVEDVDSSSTTLSLTGLTANKVYYFCLVTNDTNNKKLSSNVMSCTIGDPIPEDLRPYVKLINDTTGFTYDVFGGFTMYDYDIPVDGTNPDFDPHCRNYSWINYTYQYYPGISTYGQVVDNNYTTSTLQPVGILDINIDTSEFRITSNNVPTYMVFSTKPGRYYYRYYSGSYFYHYPCNSNAINVNTYPVSYVSQGYISGYLQLDLTNQNFTSLDYCVKYVAANYRNVNLYVDGVLWTTANNDS